MLPLIYLSWPSIPSYPKWGNDQNLSKVNVSVAKNQLLIYVFHLVNCFTDI